MKSGKKCIIMLFTLVLVVTGMVFATSKVTAADTATVTPDSKETQVVASSEVEKNAEGVPVLAGYIFAGWYKDAQAAQPYRDAVPEGEVAYAKFVAQEVLTVKAQLSADVIPEGTTADQASIRFITTVDNLKYREVGFQIAIQGIAAPITQNTREVYTSLYQIGEDGKKDQISPKMFCEASNYFCAVTMTNIPLAAWNTGITITPYWITLDGTTVYGVAATKSVDQGRKACVARIDSAYYPGVAEAVQFAKADDVIEVLRADIIDATISVDKAVTIKNAAGSSVTLTRGADLKDAVFTIAKTGNLAIQCAATGTITVDGAQVEATNSMIVNEGTFALGENAGLVNAKIADGTNEGYGGVFRNEAGATATFSGKVSGNTAMHGGAIYNSGGTVTVTGGEFKNNSATSVDLSKYGRAGAIFTHNKGKTFIEGGLFEANVAAGKYGGGALGGTGNSTMEIKGGTFKLNQAVFTDAGAYGGGAIQSAGKVTISGGTFEENTAYQGGAVYMDRGTTSNLNISGASKFNNNTATAVASKPTIDDPTTGGGGAVFSRGTVVVSGGTFETNKAFVGGAIHIDELGTLAVSGGTFLENETTNAEHSGGGAIYNQGNNLNITGGTFGSKTQGNIAHHRGGAVFINSTSCTSATITGAEFIGNQVTAVRAVSAGAIYVQGAVELTIENCRFEENQVAFTGTSTTTYTYGGVMYNNGGTVTIRKSSFVGNEANQGGAIFNKGTLTISEGTFTNNTSTLNKGATGGGAIMNNGSNITVLKSTFEKNSAVRGPAILDTGAGTIALSDIECKGSVSIDNSNNAEIFINSKKQVEISGQIIAEVGLNNSATIGVQGELSVGSFITVKVLNTAIVRDVVFFDSTEQMTANADYFHLSSKHTPTTYALQPDETKKALKIVNLTQ